MMKNPLRMHQIKNPLLRTVVKKISRLDVLEQWYDDWLQQDPANRRRVDDFLDYVLNRLHVDAQIVNQEILKSIPAQGPLVIAANHPLGGLEGMLLTKMLRELRPDLKVLTNELLSVFPEFKDVFVGVNVLHPEKKYENARGIREVARHLAHGGALLVFPAGTVSQLNLSSLTLTDAPWNNMIGRLVCKYHAPVVPIFVGGRNSVAFYLSEYIHKRLRTLLLPRAMLNQHGATIPIYIGQLITTQDLQKIGDVQAATAYIRVCCKVLQPRLHDEPPSEQRKMHRIKHDVACDTLATHIELLGDCLIYAQRGFALYCAPYHRLGVVMEQLAIERERTFRSVDEGTGQELDSDRFDPHYQHLFLWDKEQKKIAGGYRLGATDTIVGVHGLSGLYSHSLFDYNEDFLKKMGKTIEVGRSFVTPFYQSNLGALDLLWKGIGRFVALYPEYHTLFGCVSISSHYSKLVSALLTETFLSHYGAEHQVRHGVKPRMPITELKTPWTKSQLDSLSDIPVINKLVGRIDTGKSIPTLIRHYLALNGRFVSFTVNTGFNRSLDGLIIVDLRKAPDKYLKRYMGNIGFDTFKSQWEIQKHVA